MQRPPPTIDRITPEGAITEFAIPPGGAGPLQITTGPDGNLWFTESYVLANRIGRVTTSGSFTEFPIPTPNSGPDGIATGPDGALWFTESSGNKIGRITTSGAITEFLVPTSNAVLGAIVAGPDGALWFTERSGNRIGRITTSGAITEFPIPTPNSDPIFIAAGPDGALWFGESSANKIGRITTSGAITEFPIPTPGSFPRGIVAGIDGNLYFAESAANKIGRITTSGVFAEFLIPTPGYFEGITSGPDGAIWFAENVAGKIGRMSLGPLTCEPDATTLCLNDSRFRVTADWRKSDGTDGQGQATPLTFDSGYFWFFNSANIEIVTKVLNACVDPFNAYWVFSAGLTNVEVTLRVVDTYTGSIKTYVNPLNTAYQPVQDTSAFATCQQPGPRNSLSVDLGLAPSAPPCSGLTEVTGIYQDGKGAYLPGDTVVWAQTDNGIDLRIKPLCSANRRLDPLLPSAATALLTGPINPCQDSGELNTIQLKIPDLQDAPSGVVGKPSLPPDYPKAESVYFYFLVDSNHDGTFGAGDDGYNLVWQSGISLTRTEYPDRTVYELTTDSTSPNAELIQGIGSGGTSKGAFCIPLRLTATRWK